MMVIKLSPSHVKALALPEREIYAKAAFFLSLPYPYIALRCSDAGHEAERAETISTARALGFTSESVVFQFLKHEPTGLR